MQVGKIQVWPRVLGQKLDSAPGGTDAPNTLFTKGGRFSSLFSFIPRFTVFKVCLPDQKYTASTIDHLLIVFFPLHYGCEMKETQSAYLVPSSWQIVVADPRLHVAACCTATKQSVPGHLRQETTASIMSHSAQSWLCSHVYRHYPPRLNYNQNSWDFSHPCHLNLHPASDCTSETSQQVLKLVIIGVVIFHCCHPCKTMQ